MMRSMLHRVPRSLWLRVRALFPEEVESLEFPKKQWDREYEAGKWSYLGTLAEFSRFAVMAGYVRSFNRNAEILEVGCGTGVFFPYLRDVGFDRYRGIDLSEVAIETARRHARPNASFAAADGRSYSDGTYYDFIVFNEVLYYFDDCIEVMEHYRRALKPDGRFIISMVVGPQSKLHWKRLERSYGIEDSVRLVNHAGTTWDCKVIRPRG